MPGRIRIAAVILALALVAVMAGPAPAQSQDRLVLAFYYNWFDENSWGAKVPDQPQTSYVSRDRGAMGRQIDQAKGAGIDAFVVNWWGPGGNNQTDANLHAMLDEAGARGFRLAVDMDLNSPFLRSAGAIQDALGHLLNNEARHGAYLKVGGKPVIFFYHQGGWQWAGIRAAVDPGHNSLWIEEGVDVSPLAVFDGHHLYSVTWANRTDMSYTANKFAKYTRARAAELGTPKIYAATVMPGYNDLRTGRGNAFAVGREGGAYYERSWQAAMGSAPDWVVINSFNEWPEGTYIEPSQAFGRQYLDLTAKWASAFHSAAPLPPPVPAQTPGGVATGAPAVVVAAPAAGPAMIKPPAARPTPAPTRDPVREALEQRRMSRIEGP